MASRFFLLLSLIVALALFAPSGVQPSTALESSASILSRARMFACPADDTPWFNALERLLAVGRNLPARTLAQSVSPIIDPPGDANPSHLDVLSAEVIQVGDGLQFSMTLAADVSQVVVEPGHQLTYIWLVDADQDPATGQGHRYVGSEYNVRMANYDGLWQGWVDVINGGSPGGGAGLVFVHGNTISMRISQGQIGSPTTFNWEIDTFSDVSWGRWCRWLRH